MVAWNTTDARIAIVAGARTPLAKAGTALKDLHAEDLARIAMQETLLFPAETLEPVGQLARAKSAWQKTKAASGLRPRHFKPIAGLELGLTDPTVNMIMGKTAEVLVQEFGISRAEQDEFAMRSHE